MWIMPGRASGRKNSAPIQFINTIEEVEPYRKTDYKPRIYIREENSHTPVLYITSSMNIFSTDQKHRTLRDTYCTGTFLLFAGGAAHKTWGDKNI